jgi:hypothetical protein
LLSLYFLVFQKLLPQRQVGIFEVSIKFFIFTTTWPTNFEKIIFMQKPLLAKNPPKTTNIEFSETVLDNCFSLKNTWCVTLCNRCIPLGIDTETDTVTGMDTVTEMDIDMNVNCK